MVDITTGRLVWAFNPAQAGVSRFTQKVSPQRQIHSEEEYLIVSFQSNYCWLWGRFFCIWYFLLPKSREVFTSSWLLRQVTWRRSSSQAQPSGQKAKEEGRRWKTRKRSRRHILTPDLGKASIRVIFTTVKSTPCLWSQKATAKFQIHSFTSLNQGVLHKVVKEAPPSSIQRGGSGRTECRRGTGPVRRDHSCPGAQYICISTLNCGQLYTLVQKMVF